MTVLADPDPNRGPGHHGGSDPDHGGSDARTVGRNMVIALAAATVIEFVIALGSPPGGLVLLLLVALVKAWLILVHFMHVGNLRPSPARGGP